MPRVVLFTRPACHLCDVARAVVAAVAADTGAAVEEVDVRGDPDLLAEHGARVPVVAVDDREVAHFRVDPDALRAALAAAAGAGGAAGEPVPAPGGGNR